MQTKLLSLQLRRPRAPLFVLALLCVCASFVHAHPAWGIVVAREGTVYFSDVEHNRIWMLTTNGRLRVIAVKQHTHGLYLAADGYLYGEGTEYDAKNQRWVSGRWRALSDDFFEETLLPAAQVPVGLGICRDAQGHTYDIEQSDQVARIWKRTPTGQATLLAGGAHGHADGTGEAARFRFLEAITLGPDNALYVRDDDAIRRISLAGEVLTIGGKPLGNQAHSQTGGLAGLAADGRGNVYVADLAARSVCKISADNRVETVWQSSWWFTPSGVAVHNGEIYVMENLAQSPGAIFGKLGIGPYMRIYRLSANDNIVKLATVWSTTTNRIAGVAVLLIALYSFLRLRRKDRGYVG